MYTLTSDNALIFSFKLTSAMILWTGDSDIHALLAPTSFMIKNCSSLGFNKGFGSNVWVFKVQYVEYRGEL
jgi:hypothetical protein